MLSLFKRRKEPRAKLVSAAAERPEGTFDIQGTRCIGSLSRYGGRKALPVRIELRRGPDIIIDLTAEPQRYGERINFELDFGGVASAEEILREQVQVYAVDALGLGSSLKLNSATQLELIRRHFSKPREVILELSFWTGGNAISWMQGGWSQPERTFCWTVGKQSQLKLPRLDAKDAYCELTAVCSPFLYNPLITSQRAEISINNNAIAAFLMDGYSINFYSSTFPACVLLENTDNILRFYHPDAVRPCDVSSNKDDRELAFSYRSITFSKLLSF